MNVLFYEFELLIRDLHSWIVAQKDYYENKVKREDEGLISFLSNSSGAPCDYFSCKSMIRELRPYLSHRNPKVRSLAAMRIIELIPSLLTLACLLFGFSKSMLKDLAKEMLTLLDMIGDMQKSGQISLPGDALSNFNGVVKMLIETIADGDEEQKRKLLSKFQLDRTSGNDEFIDSSDYCQTINSTGSGHNNNI
ncbi:MAG: hypothetical protein HY094_07870 [Candidatus Melainabacteria bacterium]|nr:hypothetical protein [Candidatus Melainabacteria bacterium]